MPALPVWLLRERPAELRRLRRRYDVALAALLGGDAPDRPPPDDRIPTPVPPKPRPPTPPDGPPPPPPPPGRIATRYGPAPITVSAVIVARWPEAVWEQAATIAYLESGWRSGAINDTRHLAGGRCGVPYRLPDGTPATTEYSIGLFQINACAHGGDYGTWLDDSRNAQKAYELWLAAGRRWSPWYLSARKAGYEV